MITRAKKRNKLMRSLIVVFSSLLLTACSNASAAKGSEDATSTTTAGEDSLVVVGTDMVVKVVIADEVKVITSEGKEYSIPVNKVSEDDGMNYNQAFSELGKAKAESRVLPGFPDTTLDYVFEGSLPSSIKVYGGCAMKPSGEVIFPAPNYLQYDGEVTANMKIKTGSDPAHLSSDSDAYSQERYQVIKIVYEKDEQMYECYLLGQKGTAN